MFHFALVDDILSREEFERRVQQKITQTGDLIDEQTAAMLVVRECGREHVKIRDLGARASVTSFFAKVIATDSPRMITRPDGREATIAHLTVGDESGQATVVLWDDKAAFVDEIGCGDVLEIIGRPSRSRIGEVHLLAARRAGCDIAVNGAKIPQTGSNDPIAVRILTLGEVRTFTRKDQSPGEMQEGIVGDAQGTYRFVCWAPHLISCLAPGSGVRLSGAKRMVRPDGEEEVHLDQNGTVEPCTLAGDTPRTPIIAVQEGRIPAVEGIVADLSAVRGFSSRRGDRSWVRNGMIRDDTGTLAVVLWGEYARMPITDGDRIVVYGARARKGRSSLLELHAGRFSGVVLQKGTSQEKTIEGTIIPTPGGPVIDTGEEWYYLAGEYPWGREMRVQGSVEGRRIKPLTAEPVLIDPEPLRKRARNLMATR
ncbi:MAG: OB-fold nucleic acid binding domain-containing protein [Methanomicrobiales archaeon]|nr:OB-fold nucleic acid binding domain-containing protein [Methanomicrobiales archaeon]